MFYLNKLNAEADMRIPLSSVTCDIVIQEEIGSIWALSPIPRARALKILAISREVGKRGASCMIRKKPLSTTRGTVRR